MHAEQQGADAPARALRLGEATDHELLSVAKLQLDPVGAALRTVGRALALADQPFEAEPSGRFEQRCGLSLERLAEPQRGLRLGIEQRLQAGAPRFDGPLAQVLPIVEGKVEQVVADGVGAPGLEGVLQGLEVGCAASAFNDDLAVEPGLLQAERTHGGHHLRQPRRPVDAVAGERMHRVAVGAHEHAVAVELDLVQPAVALGRAVDPARELRREPRGECGARARVRGRRLGGSGAPGRRASGQHAAGFSGDDVVVGSVAREGVTLLHQQPGFLAFALARLHAHQRPQAVQLLAVQHELELAGLQAGLRIADRRPRSAVPHDHVAGAVVAGWNVALERGVVQRVVFDMHGHALVGRVEARALRHGPTLQRAVKLEPEVVVQAARRMFLHHEGERSGRRSHCARRFGRVPEVAPALVDGECVLRGHDRGARAPCGRFRNSSVS